MTKPTAMKQARNPYLPSWEYIPDGEPYVFDGRVYVYGSHDKYNGRVFCVGDYVCWSAPVDDLADWRYEGVIYPRTADPLNGDGEMCLYAPDVTVGPDGRYYLYYVLDHIPIVSVAVCDSPAGRYEFYGYVHYPDGTKLGEREGDEPQFDPGVLTEGDKTYLYTGFSGVGDKSRTGSRVVVLRDDMLTVEEEPVLVVPGPEYSEGTGFEGHEFFEASSIRKVGDKYYFVYSSRVMHELCYAVSDHPTKGFEYGGVIVSNCDLNIDKDKPADLPMAYGANNHGSIVQINDTWYVFYHRHTNGSWYSRQGCAEVIHIDDDGKIFQAEITSQGMNGKPFRGEGTYPAYLACHLFTDKPSVYVGGDDYPKIVQDGRDGDRCDGYIANIKDSATAGFRYFDCKGVKKIRIRAKGYGDGKFQVKTKWDGEALANLQVRYTNEWQNYEAELALPDGEQSLYLTYVGDGNVCLHSFTLITDETEEKETAPEEIIRLRVKITDSEQINGLDVTVNRLYFSGETDTKWFRGRVREQGVDTQIVVSDSYRTVSAGYILDGTDFEGNDCRIYIKNDGEEKNGKFLVQPRIVTDSKALMWLERAELTGEMTFDNDELVVIITAVPREV